MRINHEIVASPCAYVSLRMLWYSSWACYTQKSTVSHTFWKLVTVSSDSSEAKTDFVSIIVHRYVLYPITIYVCWLPAFLVSSLAKIFRQRSCTFSASPICSWPARNSCNFEACVSLPMTWREELKRFDILQLYNVSITLTLQYKPGYCILYSYYTVYNAIL